MTMQQIKGLTDWKRTLATKSVHATLAPETGGRTLRIIGVGRKYLRLLSNEGVACNAEPELIVAVVGL